MPAQQSRPRHAAPKDPSRRRAAMLPGVLLAAAGTAFAGMAALPAAASDAPTRVTAAAALQPVELPAAPPVEEPAPAPVEQQVNVALGTALAQGLAVANTPPPPPPPPPAPERASRDRDADAAATSGGGKYARPGTGRVTSQYGRRWGRLHAGIDIAAGVGAPIYAAAAGTVTSAGWEGGYGRAIRILHGDGTVTVYGHMSKLLVSSGERVAAGEQIGKEGNTGQSTGPHLHFEVRINGTPVDPQSWLRKRGVGNI